MRATGIALLFAAFMFTAIYLYETHKLNRLLNESAALMQTNVAGAMATFQPAMKVKDSETLGKASRTRRRFYLALGEAAAGLLGRPRFTDTDGENVVAALNELRQTKCVTADEILAAHKRVLEEAAETRERLVSEGFLPDFDSYVLFLRKLDEAPILAPKAQDGLAPLLEEAARVDRYPIGHRTALFRVRSAMDQGFQGVGLEPPDLGGSAQANLDADVRSWTASFAEAGFRQAEDEIHKFEGQWNKPLPPDLKRLLPAALHNVAMTRFAYAMISLRNSGAWGIYLLPGERVQGGASEEEVSSNFLIDLFRYFEKAIEEAEKLDPSEPLRIQVLRSAHYSMAIANARLRGSSGNAAQEFAAYAQLAPGQPLAAQAGQLPPRPVFFY